MDSIDIPFRILPTQTIAPDTHVIRQVFGEGALPEILQLNSMVITGAEPVIVDTGVGLTSQPWSEAVFSLVEPADVRWIFLSHDDGDHTGGLPLLLERCPNATIVANAFMVERMTAELPLPLERLRWVNHGDAFDAGDRRLVAFVPPVFDSPTTRGLFDTSTGVYWAADAMGAGLPRAVEDVRELDRDWFRQAYVDFQRLVAPWHRWLDQAKYDAHVDELVALGPSVVASCHGLALEGEALHEAFTLLRRLPTEDALPVPGNDELAAILASFEQVAA